MFDIYDSPHRKMWQDNLFRLASNQKFPIITETWNRPHYPPVCSRHECDLGKLEFRTQPVFSALLSNIFKIIQNPYFPPVWHLSVYQWTVFTPPPPPLWALCGATQWEDSPQKPALDTNERCIGAGMYPPGHIHHGLPIDLAPWGGLCGKNGSLKVVHCESGFKGI